MTTEEKRAAQTILLDELAAHQQDAPTLLIDALLADQGLAFLHAVLTRKASQAQQAVQITQQLVRALTAPQQTVAQPAPVEERVA